MYHRGVLQLDRLWRDAATIPRMMAISVHPYITGVPHRIDAFEKLQMPCWPSLKFKS